MMDIEFTPIGFEPMDAPWWPAMANSLTRPWPREAVLFDLRWWRGQELATAKTKAPRRARMPGRPALGQRWGWGDWDVRTVLRAEHEWADRWTAVPSSGPPAGLQPASSGHPAATTANADNPQGSSSGPPAGLQRSSSIPPHARQITVPPITDHPTPGTSSPPAPRVAPLVPPVAPVKPAKPPKPPAAPKPSPTCPGYHEAVAAFSDEHKAATGVGYPWMFQGRDADGARVKSWLAAAQVTQADPAAGVERIRLAARAYFVAVGAKRAFPFGEPASTRHFTRDLARWLQTDPTAEPPAPPGRRDAAADRRATMTALDRAIQQAQERENADRTKDPDQPQAPRSEHPRAWGALGR